MTSTLIRTCFGWLGNRRVTRSIEQAPGILLILDAALGDYLGVQNLPLIYHELASDGTDSSLSSILEADINRLNHKNLPKTAWRLPSPLHLSSRSLKSLGFP